MRVRTSNLKVDTYKIGVRTTNLIVRTPNLGVLAIKR